MEERGGFDGYRGERGWTGAQVQELPYSIETGEAEMISVDFVARGGGNATAVDVKAEKKPQASQAGGDQAEGKMAAMKKESTSLDDASLLSPEEEECTYLSLRV